MSKIWQKITTAFLCGGLAVICVCLLRFERVEAKQSLCDAFSLVGVAFLTIVALEFLGMKGSLLGLGFALKSVQTYLFPFRKAKRESYGEYRARKLAEERRAPRSHFLFVGVFYLIVACFLI